MALNITAEQYATAQSYAAGGDYVGGWEYLASIGDNYADNASAVTSGGATGIIDQGFQILVEKHWANTAGPEAYAEKFDAVAKQHFQQYVQDIGDRDGALPTSEQIEQSYRDAVTDAGLPPATAFDGVFTNTVGDLADSFWPGPKESGLDWTDFLNMENERQTESHVFDDLNKKQAWETLIKDMWDTAQELSDRGLTEAAQAWNQMLDDAAKSFIDFAFDFGDFINGFERLISDFFNNATNPPRRDPLALDLDGDGIETVAANGYNGAMFDMDGDGVRTATGWVKGDDGILVWDKNRDGQVNDGTELFAHFGDVSHMNQLTDVNGNGNGVVDASDAAFADLRVWRDLNGDGKGQSGELFTLAELGIASLNTTLTAQTTNLGNGNTQLSSGTVNYTNGATGAMGDLALQEQTIYSEFTDNVTLTAQALSLPGLRGIGMVRDLREANLASKRKNKSEVQPVETLQMWEAA